MQPQPSSEYRGHGKPGEFDFLAGHWRIAHRRLDPATNRWDEFDGEATCWSILNGLCSIEELRIPARHFAGMGVRVFDVEGRFWRDFWCNARQGVLYTPGTEGGFVDGVGTFTSQDTDAAGAYTVRGVWDEIAPQHCRWHQAISRDGGASWQDNWVMRWTRVE